MSNNKKGFWDFASDNPEIVFIISMWLIIGLTLTILGLAGKLN